MATFFELLEFNGESWKLSHKNLKNWKNSQSSFLSLDEPLDTLEGRPMVPGNFSEETKRNSTGISQIAEGARPTVRWNGVPRICNSRFGSYTYNRLDLFACGSPISQKDNSFLQYQECIVEQYRECIFDDLLSGLSVNNLVTRFSLRKEKRSESRSSAPEPSTRRLEQGDHADFTQATISMVYPPWLYWQFRIFGWWFAFCIEISMLLALPLC